MIYQLLIVLIFFALLPCNSSEEQISTSGSVNIEIQASYGITQEVLYKALEYYESICSLKDINNIRSNLGLSQISSCEEEKD